MFVITFSIIYNYINKIASQGVHNIILEAVKYLSEEKQDKIWQQQFVENCIRMNQVRMGDNRQISQCY